MASIKQLAYTWYISKIMCDCSDLSCDFKSEKENISSVWWFILQNDQPGREISCMTAKTESFDEKVI